MIKLKFSVIFSFLTLSSFVISCTNERSDKIGKFSNLDKNSVIAENLSVLPDNDSDFQTMLDVPTNLDADFLLSNVIDSIWYLKLSDVPSDILTNNLSKIKFYENRIYILDGKNKDLYVFDSEGKFQFPLHSSGLGPGEFSKVSSFSIDPHFNQIVVFDDSLSKILYYTIDGKFIKERKVGYRFIDFEFLPNGKIAVDLNKTYNDHIPEIENNQLVVVDTTWKILSKGAKYNAESERGFFFTGTTLIHGMEGLFYLQPFTSTVYLIDSNSSFVPKININFGKNSLPKDANFSVPFQEFMSSYGDDYAFMVDNGFHLKDILFYEILYSKGNRRYVFYSRRTGDMFYGRPNLDIEALGLFHVSTSLPDENVLVSYVSSEEVFQAKSVILDYGIKDNGLINLLENVESTDNPILIFYKLKTDY